MAKKRRGKYDELADIALDNIEGIEVAKTYAIEEILGQRIARKASDILQNEYSRNRYQALANALVLLIKWVSSIVCSMIVLFLVLKNTITAGELMAFLVLFGKISTPLSELPDQFDTEVGERGARLSSGERQRLSIARAILKNAPIILLDEATSALDNESEKRIADAITRLKGEKTIIMITHRQTTIQMADFIVEV